MAGKHRHRHVACFALLTACWVSMLITPTVTHAHGLGANVALARGDYLHRSFGLTWDTHVARDRPFNYRLNLNYEDFKLDENWGGTGNYHGTILVNTFGIRVHATPGMRLWAGPQLATALLNNDLGLGIGLAVGSNFHFSPGYSLGTTLAFRRMVYATPMGHDENESLAMLSFELLFRFPPDMY